MCTYDNVLYAACSLTVPLFEQVQGTLIFYTTFLEEMLWTHHALRTLEAFLRTCCVCYYC